MSETAGRFSTGWPDLDRVIKGVLAGDNIVWQVSDIERHYAPLVSPLLRAAHAQGRPVRYYRFAHHPALAGPRSTSSTEELSPDAIIELNPAEGFEPFIARVHDAIDRAGRGAVHLFDNLTELAETWCSDSMLGNFFQLTCPYLFDLETLTYFALHRGGQGEAALRPIQDTAQVFLEVYEHAGHRYLRPRKTQHRYSPTITMLHAWDGERLEPVRCSATVAEVLEAEETATDAVGVGAAVGEGAPRAAVGEYERLRRTLLAGEGALDELVRRYLTLEDLRAVQRRMIGSGRIGGKTVGMLLARAILRAERPALHARLERPDSFYVGSDAFYTYLVENGVWWLRSGRREIEAMLAEANLARRRILAGRFREELVRRFEAMIDYFGQSSFIVRSSSLLEDNYGNAFAGKYDSVFLVNQGPREQRLADLLAAARRIYASAMSERALRYRADRGLLDRDEQMALLVMRVSGTLFGRRFFPPVAGVAFSFNPYCWHPDIDPEAGVARLVFGLGTRAVDRADDDYTRLVALNAPLRQPGANLDEIRRFTQQRADVLDLDANQVVSARIEDICPAPEELPALPLLAVPEEIPAAPNRAPRRVWALNLDGLLSRTGFVADLRDMLQTLSRAYGCSVDIEFTVNFLNDTDYRIHLLQCRPLQARRGAAGEAAPETLPPDSIVLEARDALVGHGRSLPLSWLVYIPAAEYGRLPLSDRSAVARALGEVNRALRARSEEGGIAYIGPGRWGTSNPALGVPATFSQINAADAIFEVVAMHEHLIPDASLGTHFLNDLVEEDMLYAALRPDHAPNRLDDAALRAAPNWLSELAPAAARWSEVVRVMRADDIAGGGRLRLFADARAQRAVCYRAGERPGP